MVGIIGAMEIEISGLRECMENRQTEHISGIRFDWGTINGVLCTLAVCGPGKVNAAVCAQAMIMRFRPRMVINTGVAGGLYKDINVGDIVISSDALQHDFDVTGLGYERGVIPDLPVSIFQADTEMVEMAKEACEIVNPEIQCFVGRVVTGDQFISDNDKKKELVETFGGYCAEMEGAAMAQVATLNQVPFVIIRAISDKADNSAPVSYQTFEEQAIVHTVKLLAAMFLKMSK